MKYIRLATLFGAAAACPGSDTIMPHALCEISVVFSNHCQEVIDEMTARVNSADWVDPHNGGTYTITESEFPNLSGQRVTGDGKYTDKFDFFFTEGEPDYPMCIAIACSESQVFSISDYSTNYCNLHSLYCNSADGCPTVGADLTYDETYHRCRQHDNVCVAKEEAFMLRGSSDVE